MGVDGGGDCERCGEGKEGRRVGKAGMKGKGGAGRARALQRLLSRAQMVDETAAVVCSDEAAIARPRAPSTWRHHNFVRGPVVPSASGLFVWYKKQQH